MTESIKDRAAIVGIGQTEFSRSSGRSELRLALEAISAAVEEAGVEMDEIDGLIRYGASQHGVSDAWVAHNLGLGSVRYAGVLDFGGGPACALVGHAAMAVATGQANYVVAYRTLNGRSQRRPGTSDTYKLLQGQDPNYDNFLVPHGFTAPSQLYALIGRRHMHEYGTTVEQLGGIAVTAREYANRNPNAQMHGRELTLEDYLDEPLISSPLRKFDLCLQTDGAVAIVITTPERARDLKQKPVYVKAATQANLHEVQGPLHSFVGRENILDNAGETAAKQLYGSAGMGPKDIDVAQLYDCFTPTVLLQLEGYGFCEKGESGPFIADGNLRLDGAIPTNTSGGHLSEAYMHGVNHILEGVRQMRGQSTSQVPGAETCLVTAGLPVPTSALILGATN
ncbi:thiolase C-terminal domain-containing protein [Minwuia thermotolerans]|uniref:thiolase C-terminal domain-containing protein n=1 Tax=Minwuia thermotolerans TaxID=2056226 RepID=UPI0019D03277|nr:hypothetical protein [Minwuia thermotolerans]